MTMTPPAGDPPQQPSWEPPPAYPSAAPPPHPGVAPAYPGAAPMMGYGPPGPAPGLMYATFWTRFLGYLVDILLLTAVEAPISVPFLFAPLVQFYRDHPVASGQQLPPLPTDLANRFLILGLLGALVSALYFGGLVAWQGRTVGQRLAGTSVVRAEDGGRLPAERAFLRAIVFWGPGLVGVFPVAGNIAGIAAFIVLLSVAWDPRKQGWHDKLGRALVVKRVAPYPGYPR